MNRAFFHDWCLHLYLHLQDPARLRGNLDLLRVFGVAVGSRIHGEMPGDTGRLREDTGGGLRERSKHLRDDVVDAVLDVDIIALGGSDVAEQRKN